MNRKRKGPSRERAARGVRKADRPSVEVPPRCTSAANPRPQPPARSMPELFDRMMGGFMKDPSRGFPAFLDELANLKAPPWKA